MPSHPVGLDVFQSDAAPGDISFVIERAGLRLLRCEVAETHYSTALVDLLRYWVQRVDEPDTFHEIRLVADDRPEPVDASAVAAQ